MSVFIFEKSLLERLDESANVLKCSDTPVPASQVHSEWAYYVELQIEPAGWQALWKISRALCEVYNIKYPTVVAGSVTNVHFRELRADFTVSAVQDDDVHLPEFHSVPLIDLWPTKEQENTVLNIERTADCIDRLRFFYRNVWMPWDDENDDDLDWFDKHLDSRIRFCFDLKRNMSRPMADHIRMLLAEARYTQSRREVLETELEDSDMETLDDTTEIDRAHATNLMRLHLRLTVIKSEVEVLENPETRKMYEEIHFPKLETNSPNNYIVSRDGTIPQHLSFLEAVKKCIPDEQSVKIVPGLQDCLKISSPSDHIYIPVGLHKVNPVRVLNSNGSIKAILDAPSAEPTAIENEPNPAKSAVIAPIEDDSFLLGFNGAYTLENIIMDCRNVRTGIWLRNGSVTLKNCVLLGDEDSSTGTGIRISNGANVILENCIIQQFSCGINCDASANITLINSKLLKCENGLEVTEETLISIKSSSVSQSTYGIVLKSGDNTKRVCGNFAEAIAANAKLSNITGEFEFDGNQKGNVLIVRVDHCDALQNSEYIEDSFEVENESMIEIDGDISEDVICIDSDQ